MINDVDKTGGKACVMIYKNAEGDCRYVVKFCDDLAWNAGAIFNSNAYPPNAVNIVTMCSDRLQSVYSNLTYLIEQHRHDIEYLNQALHKDQLKLSEVTIKEPIQVVYASSKMLSHLLGFFAATCSLWDGVAKLSGAILTNGQDINAPGFTGEKFNYRKWIEEKGYASEINELLIIAKEISSFYKNAITIRHNLIHCNPQENFIPMLAIYYQHLDDQSMNNLIHPWRLNDGSSLLDYLLSIESKTRNLLHNFLSLHSAVKLSLLNFNRRFDATD